MVLMSGWILEGSYSCMWEMNHALLHIYSLNTIKSKWKNRTTKIPPLPLNGVFFAYNVMLFGLNNSLVVLSIILYKKFQ